jgi:type IV pilus assembly protein PilA
MKSMNKKGFTLIELLIVVVIIGILAAIAIPRFSATRERAFVSAMQSDLRNLQTLQEQFYADPNNTYQYSTDQAALGFASSSGVTVTIGAADQAGWSAGAVHAGLPAATVHCGIAVGEGTNPDNSAAVSGQITCANALSN